MPASRARRGAGGDGRLLRAADLHQRRRSCACPTCRASRRSLSHQLDHDGHRRAAGASHRHRRQLHRARIRADVSPLRQPGHGVEMATALIAREDADVSTAIREILEAEGIAVRAQGRVHRASGTRGASIASASTATRPREGRRLASAARDRTRAEHRRSRLRQGRRRDATSAATSSSTTSCRRACRASGRSATATVGARSRTRRTTTTRSSRQTCSTARSGG